MADLKNAKFLAHGALFLVALIYGLNYIVAKGVMPQFIEPRGFILLRAIGGVSLFWLSALFFPKEKTARKDHLRLAFCGFFGVACNQILFFEGLNISTPINAAVMMTVNPILVMGLAAIFLKESLKIPRLIGIVLGLAGALLLITRGVGFGQILKSDTALGNLLVLLNAASYAAYLVLVKPLMKRYKPITVIKWVFFYGFWIILPLGFSQFSEVQWKELTTSAISSMIYVVLCTTFLAYLLNVFALKTVTSTTVSFYIYLQPLFAAIAAIILGKDELTGILIGAAALLFVGVYLVSFYKRKPTSVSGALNRKS